MPGSKVAAQSFASMSSDQCQKVGHVGHAQLLELFREALLEHFILEAVSQKQAHVKPVKRTHLRCLQCKWSE